MIKVKKKEKMFQKIIKINKIKRKIIVNNKNNKIKK